MKKFTKLLVTTLFISLILVSGVSLAGCVSSPDLVIGDTIYGKTLLQVSDKGMNKTKIVVPEGVEYIAISAFLPAILTLTEVKLPKSLKRISEEAFLGCINLQTVTLPKKNNLSIIGDKAFYGCRSMQSMTFANPMELGSDVFSGCKRLTLRFTSQELPVSSTALDANAIIVPVGKLDDYKKLYFEDEKKIFADDKVVADDYISQDGSSLDKYIGSALEVTIPKSFTKIGEDAFNTTTIEKLTMPSTIIELNGALSGLTNLREVTISANITTLPDSCFFGLKKLSTVNIPADSKLSTIGSGAFRNCTKLPSVALPNTVTTIGDKAFQNCTRLSGAISLPNLAFLGSSAFENCEKLNEFNLPNITSIATSAFSNSGIITLNTGTLTAIDSHAFDGCDNLTNLPSMSKVITIGDSAFSGCSSLTAIVFGNNLIRIESNAFSDCVGINNITIPKTVNTVGYNLFENWNASQTVNVPDNDTFKLTDPDYSWHAQCNAKIVHYPM